ncbi:hypothetical protein TUN205_09006 [Pyrenophora tritici-repentis]|nr:hypothetical protein TUN205_09006 [Pyrenophora tritici-repentis]
MTRFTITTLLSASSLHSSINPYSTQFDKNLRIEP